MKTQYPWQVGSVIHRTKTNTKTLGLDAMLASPKEEDETRVPTSPLEMHEGYSVFKGTLIVKDDKTTNTCRFNIPARAIPYIHKRTAMAIEANLLKNKPDAAKGPGSGSASGSGNTPAYTLQIMSGRLKGKTPVQVLLEGGSGKEMLEKHKDFLKANLAKYPANQRQIDAIDEALALLEAEKLNTAAAAAPAPAPASGAKMTLYECAPKNIKPQDEAGRWTIYQVSIAYDSSMTLPVEVSVMNCMAPVDRTNGNEIMLSAAINKKTLSMRLSEEEWYTLIDSAKAQKIMFENSTYLGQREIAEKISNENREAAKKKSS